MYLMNVPPVAVTQTEWRTCGPPGGYSLQCFNDSDPELSSRGTPISDKVQMIIESLRSTQSSLEMGDELAGNVLSGQGDHSQVCKAAMGSYVKSKIKGPPETQQPDASPQIDHESSDSDSDGSVDRGIEEAILEYLKEKGDNKRKADPCPAFLQASKIQRKNAASPEVPKHNSDINTFLFSSGQYPKSFRVETLTAPADIPVKKSFKNKAPLNDSIAKKLALDKSTMTKSSAFPVKVEEDSNDSSSDDGIEEAIQRYQLEKREQQSRGEGFGFHAISGESDSTSDDGIEEAIRCYQLEQFKEKSLLKPFTHKNNPCTKSFIQGVGSTSIGSMNKHKLKKKKKKTRMEKEGKSALPSSFVSKNSLSESQKGNGNGLLSFKVECFKDQPTPAPPKVNTTAELMCAEAILDISKTVIPAVFHHSVELGSCAPAESHSRPSPLHTCPDEESDDSSIDSEDGIEQEIRKFLEQKAQIHKLPPSSTVTQEPHGANEPEKVKTKQVAIQKKPSKMSLTHRKKHKEENSSDPNTSGMDKNITVSLPDHRRDLNPLPQKMAALHRPEPSGDKSSSLDSDEDLDTAIKDLLKTKKKSKKKTRDLKRQSRKCLNDEESLPTNASQTKKSKPEPVPKRAAVKKVQKIKDDMKDTAGSGKKNIFQHKHTDQSGEHEGTSKGTEDSVSLHDAHAALETKEDSTSVDSDDSIELEIRRFLAEKAKVSTAVKSKDGDVSRNGTVAACGLLRDEDIKKESQLAEIPRKSIVMPFSGQPQSGPPHDRQSLTTPQSPVPYLPPVGAQLRLSSVQSCSPGLLEPADGAGAARTEQRRPSAGGSDVQAVASQMERVKPLLSPSIAHSHSESIKWRQSLGLPITDTRTLSRLPFHITSSKISKAASAPLPYPSRGIHLSSQTPASACSSSRTSGGPFSWTTEKTVNTTYRSPVLNLLSSPRPRLSFAQSQAPGHSSPFPIEGETQSMVHMPKDKSVFVELESNRTNHVQVRSRERSEGKEKADPLIEKRKEGKSVKIADKDMHLETAEEEFIDEAECESVDRRYPEKKQGLSTLSLSRAIDPGITIRPYIALTTEERSRMFCRRYTAENCNKGKASLSSLATQNRQPLQHVKRKLQFVPVDRRTEAPSERSLKE